MLDEDGSFNRISFGDSMNLDDKLRYYEHTCSRRTRALECAVGSGHSVVFKSHFVWRQHEIGRQAQVYIYIERERERERVHM